MKVLVVYYSRTGMTKIVAETVRAILQCDSEELVDARYPKGVVGYARAGRDAMKGGGTAPPPTSKDPADYDLVVLGTPVWVYTMAAPVRAWLGQNKDRIRKLALFCTCGSNPGHVFDDMEAACGLIAVSKLEIRTLKAKRAEHVDETAKFVGVLRSLE